MPDCLYDRLHNQLVAAVEASTKRLVQAGMVTLLLAGAGCAPAFSQGFSVQGSISIGGPGFPSPPSLPSLPTPPGLPPLPWPPGGSVSIGSSSNGLPPCNLDSFVYQAGGNAENIYGDEGVNGKPPLSGYTAGDRINAGINGQNDAGLTTGHGSYMPDGGGADEFIMGPNGEWGPTGPGSGAFFASQPAGGESSPPDSTQTKGLPASAYPAMNFTPLPNDPSDAGMAGGGSSSGLPSIPGLPSLPSSGSLPGLSVSVGLPGF